MTKDDIEKLKILSAQTLEKYFGWNCDLEKLPVHKGAHDFAKLLLRKVDGVEAQNEVEPSLDQS